MTVIQLDPSLRELSEEFDKLIAGAVTVAIVSVDENGRPGIMLPSDKPNHDSALAGALLKAAQTMAAR